MNLDDQMMYAWHSPTPGLEALSLVQVSRPKPGPGEVLVRVEAAALNFSDLLMIRDQYQIRPERPFVPGQEIAGTVVEAGGVGTFAVGTRVAGKVLWGGFSEMAVMRTDMGMEIPQNMGFSEAAALPIVYATAYFALTVSTQIKPGETVLVLAAAGGVGLATVEIAHHFGAKVIALAGGESKCAIARTHGADEAIDYRQEDWGEHVKSLVGEHGVDVIVDPVGGDLTNKAFQLLAWGGRLLIVGFSSGAIAKIPANRLLLKRASAIGVYWDHDRDGPLLRNINAELSSLAETGALRPHIGDRYSFDCLPRALSALGDRQTSGKVILMRHQEPHA